MRNTNNSEYKGLTDTPIKHKPLFEIVADRIVDWIMDGTLVAGQKLKTETLSKKLGVSRTPVREALRVLEQSGIVCSRPYIGTSVCTLLIEDINEIYLLREHLEALVIATAAAHVTDADLDELAEIQNRLEAEIFSPTVDSKALFRINLEFHMRMYEISRLPRACEIIKGLWASLSFFRLLHAKDPAYGKTSIKEHREYMAALRQRDAAALRRLVQANLGRHARNMPERIQRHTLGQQSKKHPVLPVGQSIP